MTNDIAVPPKGTIPEGFSVLDKGLGFSDALRPIYRCDGNPPSVGIVVQHTHTNLLNICHGGVLMTLADVGASWAVNHARGEVLPAPTLNLTFDFISAAKLGEWLQVDVDRISLKRSMGFASGVISSGNRTICRFSGSFFFPEPGRFDVNAERLATLQKRSGDQDEGSSE